MALNNMSLFNRKRDPETDRLVKIALTLAFQLAGITLTAIFTKKVLDYFFPTSLSSSSSSTRQTQLKGGKGNKVVRLNEYEQIIFEHLVDSNNISTTFESIGGLADQKSEVLFFTKI
jgi:hypothetical protein